MANAPEASQQRKGDHRFQVLDVRRSEATASRKRVAQTTCTKPARLVQAGKQGKMRRAHGVGSTRHLKICDSSRHQAGFARRRKVSTTLYTVVGRAQHRRARKTEPLMRMCLLFTTASAINTASSSIIATGSTTNQVNQVCADLTRQRGRKRWRAMIGSPPCVCQGLYFVSLLVRRLAALSEFLYLLVDGLELLPQLAFLLLVFPRLVELHL